ncbi:HEAT repeat domain-containing protein [Chitinophaga arvensicola]|uniref:DNA alkylation repair enzyme n=1 Tax=Chitinophaga arvensicola TaxID=29529 RepID=A0A1I0RPI8_9BACT|nr:HEAT repeat domain-containing protein [Chitinophaga arvensicola]SEW43223.1 DNA alkylation repair enzyme [Chitinophaga arvensicola]
MMLNAMIASIKKVEHGFKHILEAGSQLLNNPDLDHLETATRLIQGESYQERGLGVWLLGLLSPENPSALQLLRTSIPADENWRVQEMLAKAFDYYCSKIGYEQSLPEIRKWLKASHPNLNRAVVEGLRIWTGRPYFKTHPEVAIALISAQRSKESEYLRKSVGNALRDISKKHRELVMAEVDTWDLDKPRELFVYKLVMK